jgi:glycosyltransferase involved in cell wall biosynthesis
MAETRLIIDVTQWVHWQGTLTGIPRVMDEIARRYVENPQAVFVIWNKASEAYVQVDFAATRKIRGNGICYINGDRTTNASKMSGAKKLIKKTESLRVGRSSVAVLKRIKRRITPEQAQAPAANIIVAGKQDTLLVLWGEWHDPTFIRGLEDAKSRGATLVQAAMDMLPIVTPQFSGAGNAPQTMANYNAHVLPICDLVLSISENTKRDIIAWLKAKKLRVPPVEVIRIGDDLSVMTPQKPKTDQLRLAAQEPFVLCVGTVEARKNHALLYYVAKLAQSKGITLPKIVIVGRRGWRSDDVYGLISEDPEMKDRLIFLHGMSDEELDWLYSNCLFTVYPSFYEGWGIPIAESVRKGVPVAASNTSSMPEIAGNLIDYFSPFSTDECLETMKRLSDPTYLKKAQQRLLKYKVTSWDDSFQQINTFLKEVHENN